MPKSVDNVAWLGPDLYPDASPGGEFRAVGESGDPQDGDLVVWVDDSPDDPIDASGHFERFTGSPADYTPTRKKGEA